MWALGVWEGDASRVTLARFAMRVAELVPLNWPLADQECRGLLEIARQTQQVTLGPGAPPWWQIADVTHYGAGLAREHIPEPILAGLARNAAENRPPAKSASSRHRRFAASQRSLSPAS